MLKISEAFFVYFHIFFLLLFLRGLCEMCPNTEFFLVRIFPYSDWIRRDTSYLSTFSLNTGKYGLEKTPYSDTFHAVADTLFHNECWKEYDVNLLFSLKSPFDEKWSFIATFTGSSDKFIFYEWNTNCWWRKENPLIFWGNIWLGL